MTNNIEVSDSCKLDSVRMWPRALSRCHVPRPCTQKEEDTLSAE